jgi:hypothetical protein
MRHSALIPDWLGTLRRYLALFAAQHSGWEAAQLPLYSIWTTGTRKEQVFAIAHCTAGDVLSAARPARRSGSLRTPCLADGAVAHGLLHHPGQRRRLHRLQRMAQHSDQEKLGLFAIHADFAMARDGARSFPAMACRADACARACLATSVLVAAVGSRKEAHRVTGQVISGIANGIGRLPGNRCARPLPAGLPSQSHRARDTLPRAACLSPDALHAPRSSWSPSQADVED